MEEWVGGLWDRFITRAAARTFPDATVNLADMQKILGVVFRGLGGDPGLQVHEAREARHGGRRSWLEKIAGTGQTAALPSIDGARLQLPEQLAVFPEKSLNRDLYLWLAAQAAHLIPGPESWLVRNQRATVVTLERFPALAGRYQRLVAASLALRPLPVDLPEDEAAQERVLRQAMEQPGSVRHLPLLTRRSAKPPQQVPLWLYPSTDSLGTGRALQHQEKEENPDGTVDAPEKRHLAEQVDAPENEHGFLISFRAESLLSWAEYIKVNRSQDDDPDPNASDAAKDIERLSLMQDNKRVAARIRFNLDLPAAEEDDERLGEGIPLPEWDFRRQSYRPDYCLLQEMASRDVEPIALPPHLRPQARRLRQQFAVLAPARRWLKAQPEGVELDIDAWVRHRADCQAGTQGEGQRVYLAQVQQERDLACLVLADLSLSTDAHANDTQKVVDVIRDSLMLFAEALGETGDRFALYGFSSLKRQHVRFHPLKTFDTPYDAMARGRIQAIKPGYYTRLGAAIRQSTKLLAAQPCRQRLLLILSDGKPHDLDVYEGRYGIEDTRQSIHEARQQGVQPFCVTIDREGASYLPHVFGAQGFTLLRRADELSEHLPILYAQLTRS